ncbi:Uncharacterised protein [Mycobacteroides abscessus subsp. abscessus]|nr:Uncharacterised protein [Mycobacteroides abscessus subsp. abscessus]
METSSIRSLGGGYAAGLECSGPPGVMEDCFVEQVGFPPKGRQMDLPVSIANYSGEHCVRGLGGYAKRKAGDFLVGYQAGFPGRLANQVDAWCGAQGHHGDLESSHIRER